MTRAKTTKKAASRISKKDEDRIVELSMQNPEFGARRLLSLLKKEKISISASRVYSVLKRNGLQNRQARLAKLDEPYDKKDLSAPEKTPVELTPETEERIVEISLQNTDFGGRRLAGVLAGEGIIISSSAVYTLLKRHGLQNRSLRLSRIELERLTEPPAPAVETVAPHEIPKPAPAKVTQRVPQDTGRAWKTPPAVSAAQIQVISTRRARWFFFLGNMLLLALIGYLGYQAVLKFKQAGMEPVTTTTVAAARERVVVQQEPEVQPLKAYSKIWERNLFNITVKNSAAPKKEIPIEKIALAKKDIGLQLMGTVVADDPRLSRAIIDNRSIRKQEAYREGDSAGKVKIKKILRNNVVVTTAKGDKLLTVEIKETGGRSTPYQTLQQVGSRSTSAQQATGNRRAPTRTLSLNLNRDEVAASLADIDTLMEQVRLSPYMQGGQPSGFRLGIIPADSVLRKMGLRYRDVIVGVGEESITGPNQGSYFFQKLAEGSEVTIKLKRRRRTRNISLKIE
jgi:type II secretion system protein C